VYVLNEPTGKPHSNELTHDINPGNDDIDVRASQSPFEKSRAVKFEAESPEENVQCSAIS
jgi:hypothetical protein